MRQTTPSTNTYLIVDKREKAPGLLLALKQLKYKWEWGTLEAGDYACSDGDCGTERKDSDFTLGQIDSMNRQLANLQTVYENSYLIVNINSDQWLAPDKDWICPTCHKSAGRAIQCMYCGGENPTYLKKLGYINSLNARGLTPQWIPNYLTMLHTIIGTMFKNHDGKFRGPGAYHPIRQVSHKDQVMNTMISLPGVGPKLAKEILKHYESFGEFINGKPKDWLKIKGMGKKTVENILNAFWKGSEA